MAKHKKNDLDLFSPENFPDNTLPATELPTFSVPLRPEFAFKNRKDVEITDFGSKILGAKKDSWNKSGITLDNLNEFTDSELDKLIDKKNIVRLDPAAMIAAGQMPEIVCMFEQVLQRVGSKPHLKPGETLSEIAPLYIKMLNRIVELGKQMYTKDDVNRLIPDLLKDFPRTDLARLIPGSQRSLKLYVDYSMSKKVESIMAKGYPEKLPEEMWRGKFIIHPALYKPTDENGNFEEKSKTGYSILTKQHYYAEKTPKGYPIYHNTEDEAVARARELYQALDKSKTKTQVIDPPERIVGDYSEAPDGKTHAEDEILKRFKIRGGQFGNYQNDRQKILNNSFFAFEQLSKTLNIPPSFISLGGKLGIAYGARGRSNAAAHFEPTHAVINLTKGGGAGSLAHEWAHAVDYALGEVANSHAKKPEFLSRILSNRLDASFNENNSRGWRADLILSMAKVLKTAMVAPDGFGNTRLYENSRNYDRGRSKPYYSQPIEIFARVFETYIFDKIKDTPNNYLVSGLSKLETDPLSKQTVYPQGAERDSINWAIDDLVKVISENSQSIENLMGEHLGRYTLKKKENKDLDRE